jgi:TrmH family RNA methyltransferase
MTINESRITSIKDPRVIFARSLKTTSGRKQQQACLLFGIQALLWAVQSGWFIQTIFCTPDKANEVHSLSLNAEICLTSDGIMKKISETSYLIPVLSIATYNKPVQQPNHGSDMLLMLDNIVDQGNIGTIIRTACAFGIKHFALCEMDCDSYQRKTVNASRGTVFEVHATSYQNSEAEVIQFKNLGYQVIVTTPYGSGLQSELKLENKPVVLVIGNESEGVQPSVIQLADVCVQIPMQPEVESLNVGVAAGISMYEVKIKAVLAMLKQKIQSTLGREINVASQLIMQKLNHELSAVSQFSGNEAVFLMQLSCDREMYQAQISHNTGFIEEDLQKFLNHLQNNNFIQPADNKSWQITASAEKWLAEIWPVVESTEKKALMGFSEEEILQLGNFITRIQKNCES